MKSKTWERVDSDLVLHLPTGMYYVRRKKKGKKPLFKATGYTTKGKAKTKAMLLIAEWMGRARGQDGEVILFREFTEDYLIHLEKTKLRPRTKEQARIYLGALIEEIGHMDLRAINEGFFDEWIADFRGRSQRGTFADYAKYLSKAMRHAHRKGLVDRLPSFKNPDAPKRAGRVYTREEIVALIDNARPELELQLRLSLQAFMRLREVLHLTWDRIQPTGMICLGADDVKTGSKTGQGRAFYVNEEIRTQLHIQHRRTGRGKYVFPAPGKPDRPQWSNRSAWKLLKSKSGITGRARWHDLRHTALTRALIDERVNPLLVSKYAGVSMRTIERVYLHVRPEDMREVSTCIKV